MTPLPSTTQSYPVEVSGWDAQDRFFVENTALDWDELAGKSLRLRTPIHRGTVLFIRLFDAAALDALPVAYQARAIERDDSSPLYRVALAPVEPTRLRFAPRQEAMVEPEGPDTLVAESKE